MRSMELVGRERMEVAVSAMKLQLLLPSNVMNSNNCPSGAKHATTMSQMSPIS